MSGWKRAAIMIIRAATGDSQRCVDDVDFDLENNGSSFCEIRE